MEHQLKHSMMATLVETRIALKCGERNEIGSVTDSSYWPLWTY
jgi:hypothetical protein